VTTGDRSAIDEQEDTMRNDDALGCRRCRMRSRLHLFLRVPFQYCDECKKKRRVIRHAWKSWSQDARTPLKE
jgi:hypothetical protein